MNAWQPIATASTGGTPILAGWFDEFGKWRVSVVECRSVGWPESRYVWCEADGDGYALVEPQYWQPLPGPPPPD